MVEPIDTPDYDGMPLDDAVALMNERGLIVFENCTVVLDGETGKVVLVSYPQPPDEAFAVREGSGIEFLVPDRLGRGIH